MTTHELLELAAFSEREGLSNATSACRGNTSMVSLHALIARARDALQLAAELRALAKQGQSK